MFYSSSSFFSMGPNTKCLFYFLSVSPQKFRAVCSPLGPHVIGKISFFLIHFVLVGSEELPVLNQIPWMQVMLNLLLRLQLITYTVFSKQKIWLFLMVLSCFAWRKNNLTNCILYTEKHKSEGQFVLHGFSTKLQWKWCTELPKERKAIHTAQVLSFKIKEVPK